MELGWMAWETTRFPCFHPIFPGPSAEANNNSLSFGPAFDVNWRLPLSFLYTQEANAEANAEVNDDYDEDELLSSWR